MLDASSPTATQLSPQILQKLSEDQTKDITKTNDDVVASDEDEFQDARENLCKRKRKYFIYSIDHKIVFV